MRKKLIFILVSFFVLSIFLKAEKKYIEIPLRVFGKNFQAQEVKKEDLLFKVNGKDEKAFLLVKEVRNFKNKGLPLKYFVLDFNLFDYYNGIGEAIDYFVDNVLTDEPVILLTRNKIYRFFNYNSKAYLKKMIRKLVREDTLKFKAEISSYHKKFRGILSRISSLSKESCQRFINDYLREWKVYKTRFVYPDLRKYQMLSNLLANKDGDKFIISFQHREVIPYYNKVQKALARMNDFVSSAVSGEAQAWATMISGGINDINQSLLLSKSFPSKKLLNNLLFNNLSFNLILLNNKMNQKEGSGYNDVSPDMEKLLSEIAGKTGGIAVISDNLKDSIDKIKSHDDVYYYIRYKIKKAADYRFEISSVKKTLSFSYPDFFRKAFLKNLFKLRKNKVKISNFSISEGRIGFSLSNFKMVKKGGKTFGVLKVGILVFDKTGKLAYKTGNILNSVKKSINIKLPPVYLNGNFKLFITVKDMVGESSSIFEREVKF